MEVIDKHAPMKQKTIRGNHSPFMNKLLSKAFMQRSKFKNSFNKNPCNKNKELYRRQRNYCVNLLKREKKNYYNNLDLGVFSDNKKFWNFIRPLFSDKQKHLQKNIMIIEDDNLFSEKEAVAEKLNNFFAETIDNLNIEHFHNDSNDDNENENIEDILRIYKSHPSIVKIKENITIENKFSFAEITSENFQKLILNLDYKKASVFNDIPVKVLAKSSDIVSDYLCTIYNNTIQCSEFPNSLKLADVIPIHKKDEAPICGTGR